MKGRSPLKLDVWNVIINVVFHISTFRPVNEYVARNLLERILIKFWLRFSLNMLEKTFSTRHRFGRRFLIHTIYRIPPPIFWHQNYVEIWSVKFSIRFQRQRLVKIRWKSCQNGWKYFDLISTWNLGWNVVDFHSRFLVQLVYRVVIQNHYKHPPIHNIHTTWTPFWSQSTAFQCLFHWYMSISCLPLSFLRSSTYYPQSSFINYCPKLHALQQSLYCVSLSAHFRSDYCIWHSFLSQYTSFSWGHLRSPPLSFNFSPKSRSNFLLSFI